ncbi:DUF2637 domain-containing protein [Streptomyces fuscigenes]|uniref:DUF2637 domain-containing protein n=1 Tax=Streptomyces fuscigenes TaxID=1528880 RepID=UPI001F224194|nr:DUF2637 domain-containing protein [Streptomyces fuscigenes]MCF3961396.1 DUF2637 domain-containing protein [Streptomyces fuscigenes]
MPRIRVDAVLIQAVIAGALSFAHLHDLAEAAGQHGWKAWAYPISVDLLLMAAWRRMRTLRTAHQPARAVWAWFAVALAASLGANVSTAGLLDLHAVPAWLRILVAGWPALAFLGGTLLAHNPTPDTTTAPGPQSAPAPEPADDMVTVERETDPAPELPTADPAPAPAAEAATVEPAPAPAPVPPALLDYARKTADAHRDSTGRPIDADTLRARLGVPGPLAASLVAQLT